MPAQWIAASYALQFVACASDEHQAALTICQHAHNGLLQSKAKLVTCQFGQAKEERTEMMLPARFWWAEGHGSLKQNWQTGDFSTFVGGVEHWQAFGVSFDFSKLIELAPAVSRAKGMAAISVAGSPDWLAARFASVEAYRSGLYQPGSAQAAILELCRTGHIVARALRMEKRSRGWDGEPEEVAVEWDVPLWFWRNFTGSESSAQQWDTGVFSGLGKCDECKGYVRLSGVHFLKVSITTLTGAATDSAGTGNSPPNASDPTRDAVTNTVEAETAKLPPLSDAKLQQWWEAKEAVRDNLSLPELLILIRATFPANHIARDRIRALAGSRKRGPKPIGG